MHIRLGTRTSYLALTQSRWVARHLENHAQGISVEIVGIQTHADESQGNANSTTPLPEMDGKNFFVKEIDDAMLEGRIDMAVHSFKDLSLDRPKEINLAAIPPRLDPRDIMFFSPNAPEKIIEEQSLIIGTSSPRRQENTPIYLESKSIKTQMTPLRGNVNSRLKRLLESPSSDRYMDGVVLALAGIIRLINDEEYGPEIRTLISNLPCLTLPLALCPTSPGQGALAIECRSDAPDIIQHIRSALHCEKTAHIIREERTILEAYGGGCHQAFGATKFRDVLCVKGKDSEGDKLNNLSPHINASKHPWFFESKVYPNITYQPEYKEWSHT